MAYYLSDESLERAMKEAVKLGKKHRNQSSSHGRKNGIETYFEGSPLPKMNKEAGIVPERFPGAKGADTLYK